MDNPITSPILVVDDNQVCLALTEHRLKKAGCQYVLTFFDPKTALDHLSTISAQRILFLVDYLMPCLNGVEFLFEVEKVCTDFHAYIVTSTPESVAFIGRRFPIIEKGTESFDNLLKNVWEYIP